jgi:predicted Zn-dependent protease
MTAARRGGPTSQETAEEVLRLGTAQADVTGCVALVAEESAAHLRWAGNELTTHGEAWSRSVVVVAVIEGRAGARVGICAHRGDIRGVLPYVVAAATARARAAEPAEDARPLVPAGSPDPEWGEPVGETTTAAFADLAPALAAGIAEARGRGHRLAGYAEDVRATTFLATSTGVRRRADRAARRLELAARADDGGASAWETAAGDLGGEAFRALHDRLEVQLRWGRRRLPLRPGRYETVLPPAAVADLMTHVYAALGGRDAAEGHSAFSGPGGRTRVGERLSDLPLRLRGDPAAPGLECASFVVAPASDGVRSVFDNGLPLAATAWIDDGVLAALLQSRFSAALTGLPLTPPLDNLILDAPGRGGTLDDFVAHTERGLLLTSLWYLREVDPATLLLTGVTRDGVYLVDGGEVVGAVPNFRFNESPVDLLRRITDVGGPVPTRGREGDDAVAHAAMPPVRVADFALATPSEAF